MDKHSIDVWTWAAMNLTMLALMIANINLLGRVGNLLKMSKVYRDEAKAIQVETQNQIDVFNQHHDEGEEWKRGGGGV